MKTSKFNAFGSPLNRSEMRNILGGGSGYFECNDGTSLSRSNTNIAEMDAFAQKFCGRIGVKKVICSGEGCAPSFMP